MSPYRAAIIGVGEPQPSNRKGGGHQIGYTHARMYGDNAATRLVAAADINPDNLNCFLDARPGVQAYHDYRTMLRAARPDIVSICTYVGLHGEMIEACVEAGARAIVCEKPFVNSPQELIAIETLLRNEETKLVVTHIRRNYPAFREAARLFQSGAVGEPILTCTGLEGWDLSEMGSHHFDLTRMFYGDGEVEYVMGQARVTEAQGYGHAMEDHAVAYIGFRTGGRGVIDGGRAMHNRGFSLVGQDGVIHILDEHIVDVVEKSGTHRLDYSDGKQYTWKNAWSQLLRDLLEWMAGGPAPASGLPNAARSAELNLAAYVSMIRGDRVDLPLVDSLQEWPVDLLARRARERQLVTAR